jgi:ferredoxin
MTTTQAATEVSSTQIPRAASERLPALATAVIDAKATRKQMFTLRHFHLGDPAAKGNLESVTGDCLPALLDPFRDTSRLRYDYPLFLFPPAEGDGHQDADALVCSLAQWLEERVQGFAPGKDESRILKDHLPWLEYHLRQGLKEREGPVPAAPALETAGVALQEHLDLDPGNRDRLAADLERLQVAAGRGEVMGYGRFPSLHLLIHSVRSRVVPRRTGFQAEVDACIRGLEALFEVEWGKSDESIEPRQARDSVGPAGARFDPHALSSVMDHSRGTHKMAPERRERIEQALAVLRDWRIDPVLARLVHLGAVKGAWLAESPDVEDEYNADPCAHSTALFDREANKLAEVFSAVRIARLEIDGIYDPVIHDPWFANFDWEGFSKDELSVVPVVVAVEGADRVAGPDMRSFSRLLSSGRPVQILIRVQPRNNPGAGNDEDPFQDFRTELGYLGLSHRQAAVTQSSASRFGHLTECFLSSLDTTRTSLHLINTGMRSTHNLVALNAWLVAGAAIEGRAHPFFRSFPGADESVPEVMDFSGNPEQETDWPVHPFHYLDDSGNKVTDELAFTFADYCLLIERLRDHYRLVPPGCDSDALVPMQEYLAMAPDQAYWLVPFIWAVDGNAALHRLVVSRELAMACLDRLNFWRTLQQMAGVRNPYVDKAIERTREDERHRAAGERERLVTAHAEEVERVRTEAAGEAMQRLTDHILGLDLSVGLPGGAFAPPAPAAKPSPAADARPEPQPEERTAPEAVVDEDEDEDEELSFDEPWIDTPLCTSCNDCMKINQLVFVYNEEKQALLGDMSTATYAQLVEAAELCPAKCIHPGKPWNPHEPGLGALVERAAPFNQ